jgi:glycosyltransferase involved in cell wall biosynthesis
MMSSLFNFINYVSPSWYFNIKTNKNKISYFIDYDKLNDNIKNQFDLDLSYSSYEVSKLDFAYKVFHSGLILVSENLFLETRNIKPSISDNYKFINKYFHPIWPWYILILRLFSFYNPIIELLGFIKNYSIKRNNDFTDKGNIKSEDFLLFKSSLISSNPRVSVILPTLNRYSFLKLALSDLEFQSYSNFEVLIVDQSDLFDPFFYHQFNLDIKVIRQEEKALWLARNSAIQSSLCDYIVMYEDDVRVKSDWLENHLKCLDFFNVDISTGVFYPSDSSIPSYRNYFKWAEQFSTGNVCLKKNVFAQIGLFDRQFERQRMGDGEFGLRAYLFGFKSISNPYASCEDVKAPIGGLRDMGSWDSFRTTNLLAPRPLPSVLYFIRKYFGKKNTFYFLLSGILNSLTPYRFKRSKFLTTVSIFFIIPILPLIIFQIIKSWKLSTKFLNEGDKIQYLLK